MSLVSALRIASICHHGVNDKGGFPFIGHPLRVMATVARLGFPEYVLEAAILHDVVEDTNFTKEELLESGISFDTVALVDLMTRPEGMTYADYIQRIKESESYAIDIKLADIADNLDPARAVEGSDKLRPRYLAAIEVLEGE
jgi:(p)ppGpp synthase/HD superfamily hydrolase